MYVLAGVRLALSHLQPASMLLTQPIDADQRTPSVVGENLAPATSRRDRAHQKLQPWHHKRAKRLRRRDHLGTARAGWQAVLNAVLEAPIISAR
jgi:hypothetical protein